MHVKATLSLLGVAAAVVTTLAWSGCSDPSADPDPHDAAEDASADGTSGAVTDGGADGAAAPIVCPAGPPGSEKDAIKPLQHDGQTFVTWQDVAQGDAGVSVRYDVYRALAPITQANLASAERVAKGVLDNSGKLFGTTFNEASRIDLTPAAGGNQPAGMTVIEQDAAPLPPWTGLFVHTAQAEACAYYAVVPTDLKGEAKEPVTPGKNATTAPIAEHVGAMQPIKLYDSKNRGIYSPQTQLTGKKGLPLQVLLHASNGSGGGAGDYGDYYVYYANQDMAHVDGLPGVFSVEETHSGSQRLMMRNRDTIVAPLGTSGFETYWFGYQCVPDWAPTRAPRAYPFTEQRLLWMIEQAISRYAADREHVSCQGGSMGAWGSTSFGFHHPELFSAVYPDRPRTRQTGMPSLVATPTADQAVMSDGTTPFLERMDSVKFAAEHHEDLPFYAWDIGRNDGFAPWKDQVDMAAALAASHHGFAFMWNNGDHSGTIAIADQLQAMYPPEKFGLHQSYPAFANSSIDNKLGNGSPTDGDLQGGINLGFDWTAVEDQPKQWKAALTNALAIAAMTVDVTPRRCQKFLLKAGDAVSWTTSSGGSGTIQADAWGLVTVPKVAIAPGQPTVVTLTH